MISFYPDQPHDDLFLFWSTPWWSISILINPMMIYLYPDQHHDDLYLYPNQPYDDLSLPWSAS